MRNAVAVLCPLLLACATPTEGTPPVVAAPAPVAQAPAPAPTIPAPVKVATVEGITEYRLHNGLRVLLFPDASKPTVLVNITYLVGSRQEGYGETGMAHLLEHMLFKGTPTHPDIWKSLQEHGANFNGSTWWDRTNYFEELPASPANLEFALKLEADRMVASKIAGEDLAKEFSVVRNEFERSENRPDGVLEDKMMATAFQWHNYGKSTIGSRSDIERVPVDNLRAFYRRYYRPDNAVLIVAGKVDPQQALSLVQAYFGPVARPATPLPSGWTEEPVQDGERVVTLRRTGDVPLVSVLYHGVAGAHPDKVVEEAIVDILTNKPSGRLYQALVEKGLASEVTGNAYPMAEPGVVMFTARLPKDGSPEKVRDVMLATIESLGKAPVTQAELARFRAGFDRDFELILNETVKTGVVLSEFAAMGDWRLFFLMRDRVKAITVADVARVASSYLKPSNRTLGLFLPTANPDRAPLATRVDVAPMVKDYQGQPPADAGEAFVASLDNLEARTTRMTMPGGMRLALLPKKTKGGQVRLSLTLRFGAEQDLRGKLGAAALLPEMIGRGSRKYTFQQLKDRLDVLKAAVTFGGGHVSPGTQNVAQVQIKTTRENLPAVLEVIGEILREPTFPPAELEALRKEILAKLEEQLTDPMANASVALMKALLPYDAKDVRYTPSLPESIARVKAITVRDLSTLYKKLWGGSFSQLAIVGDFDPAAVQAGFAATLDAWKSPKPYARIKLPFRANQVVDTVIDTPDKQMAFVAAGETLELRDDDPDYPALFMVNYLLGGSPASRLFLRLRQQEGISYGTFSRLSAHPLDRSTFFFAGALCAPANMDRAQGILVEEIGKLASAGATEKELADAKASYAKGFEGRLASDDFVLGELNQGLFLGRTFAYWKDLNDKIAKLTLAQVNAAAQRYLLTDRLAKIRAGDLQKRPAAGK
jgi:zinc protease